MKNYLCYLVGQLFNNNVISSPFNTCACIQMSNIIFLTNQVHLLGLYSNKTPPVFVNFYNASIYIRLCQNSKLELILTMSLSGYNFSKGVEFLFCVDLFFPNDAKRIQYTLEFVPFLSCNKYSVRSLVVENKQRHIHNLQFVTAFVYQILILYIHIESSPKNQYKRNVIQKIWDSGFVFPQEQIKVFFIISALAFILNLQSNWFVYNVILKVIVFINTFSQVFI
eukprot:TRINITY_DN101_c0_g1_i1.p2 TRINITY_DN101_c0_g1~~TRINITY_DN101_c0_g1_i1.p2  ORF type:complete len:224 (-),score=-6.63 TRINITY_DN101_c0_g1_i1:1702-2373(-)